MARLIDADQAIAEADRLLEHYNLAMANAENNREINHVFKRQELFKAVRAVVNACPTVDPVKHGRWIQAGQPNENSETLYRCSICGYLEVVPLYDTNNYCGNCGAKMDQDTGGDNNGIGEAKKE